MKSPVGSDSKDILVGNGAMPQIVCLEDSDDISALPVSKVAKEVGGRRGRNDLVTRLDE